MTAGPMTWCRSRPSYQHRLYSSKSSPSLNNFLCTISYVLRFRISIVSASLFVSIYTPLVFVTIFAFPLA